MKKATRSLFAITLLAASSFSVHAQVTGMMSTLVGTAGLGYSGDNGPAHLAQINYPTDICLDANNNIYVVDAGNYCVRKINATTGIITTVAGNGTSGYAGDGGQGNLAQLSAPGYMCLANGNLYIADGGHFMNGSGSNTIRKVNINTGIITTIAGVDGTSGYSGDGGPATAAQLSMPTGICADNAGNIYFADRGNHCVRKIAAQTGIITTICGNGTAGSTGSGSDAASALLSSPTVLDIDNNGNIYVVDQYGTLLRRIDGNTNIITDVTGYGGMVCGPVSFTSIGMVWGIVCDDNGDVYITDESCSCRKINTGSGQINLVGGDLWMEGFNGDSGPATQIWYNRPMGLDIHPVTGDIIVADMWNSRIRLATQPLFIISPTENGNHTTPNEGVNEDVETPTTVPVAATSAELRIYPNPSSGRIYVENGTGRPANIAIYSHTGTLVSSSVNKGGKTSIDLSEKAAGIYQVTINGKNTQKVVVTK